MSVIPIIIPFYKEHEKLRKCRAAIDAQTWPGLETFVRDNTHDNIYYTAAVNEGLAKYCYRPDVRYVIVLNQDANMDKECVRHLVEFMDAHPECGIACPVQYTESGTPMRLGASGGVRMVTWGGSLQAFPMGVHRKDPLASYKEPFETYWANGACMMIRVEAVRECGLFDRNMRFICSDSDFSFTARARGWKVFVVPKALCEHSLGASARGTTNPVLDLVKVRDAAYFTEKWLTGGLYRRMALEGPGLSGIAVRGWLKKLQRDARWLERFIGEATPTENAWYPSWQTEMHIPPQPPVKGRF